MPQVWPGACKSQAAGSRVNWLESQGREKIMVRCPGQDQRFWKPDDIFEVQCSGCGRAVEFFKDEPKLKCPGCGQIVVNPKIDLGCARWCFGVSWGSSRFCTRYS